MKCGYIDRSKHYDNNTLYIIRGLPGAGKSTIGAALCGELSVVSADDYFMNDNYEYLFDASKLGEAHKYCLNTIKELMRKNNTPIAVANTFIKKEHMQPYYEAANRYGYNVIELIVKSTFKSVHGVPNRIIEKMSREFEA